MIFARKNWIFFNGVILQFLFTVIHHMRKAEREEKGEIEEVKRERGGDRETDRNKTDRSRERIKIEISWRI